MKPEDCHEADALQEMADVACSTECTGLMPALPRDDAEDAASASLCAIHNAKGARRKQFRKR